MLIVVAAALTLPDARVLVQQRPTGGSFAGCWEFPGGKVEAGETCEAALVRELVEELGIDVDERALLPLCFATETLAHGSLVLLLYRCRHWRGEPVLLHASASQWVEPASLIGLTMPPADAPLVEMLVKLAAMEAGGPR